MNTPTTLSLLGVMYPGVMDCLHGHAAGKPTFFEEVDDDRSYVMIVDRCSRCKMPCGESNYANPTNQERYYAGLEPVAQND